MNEVVLYWKARENKITISAFDYSDKVRYASDIIGVPNNIIKIIYKKKWKTSQNCQNTEQILYFFFLLWSKSTVSNEVSVSSVLVLCYPDKSS